MAYQPVPNGEPCINWDTLGAYTDPACTVEKPGVVDYLKTIDTFGKTGCHQLGEGYTQMQCEQFSIRWSGWYADPGCTQGPFEGWDMTLGVDGLGNIHCQQYCYQGDCTYYKGFHNGYDPEVAAIGGIIGGVFAFLCYYGCIIGCICILKKRKQYHAAKQGMQQQTPVQPQMMPGQPQYVMQPGMQPGMVMMQPGAVPMQPGMMIQGQSPQNAQIVPTGNNFIPVEQPEEQKHRTGNPLKDRLNKEERKLWKYQCVALVFLVLIHIPIFVLFGFIQDWGTSRDASWHYFLEVTEGYGSGYIYPFAVHLAHAGCMIFRYLNFGQTRAGWELVANIDQCRDPGPGFFYWDTFYYRPDDTNAQGSQNYMILVGAQHTLISVMLIIVVFFNAPFMIIMMIPGINWLMYGIIIIINSVVQCYLMIQYTFFIVFGWIAWIVVIPVVGVPGMLWLLFQWYEKYSFYCNLVFPGVIILVWLLPINMALTIGSLRDNNSEGGVVACFLCAVIASFLRPTGIACFFIFFRIGKDWYYKEWTGYGSPDNVMKVTNKDKGLYLWHTAYQLYDCITDIAVWMEGDYLEEVGGVFGMSAIIGIVITVGYIIVLSLKTWAVAKSQNEVKMIEEKRKKYEQFQRGGEYYRMLLEDIPMTIVQLYSMYRRKKGLTDIGYMGLFGSMVGIYGTLIDIMVLIAYQNADAVANTTEWLESKSSTVRRISQKMNELEDK